MISWQGAKADSLEIEADLIEAALVTLRRLEGLFEVGSQVDRLQACLDFLETENSNRRTRADRLREQVKEVHDQVA